MQGEPVAAGAVVGGDVVSATVEDVSTPVEDLPVSVVDVSTPVGSADARPAAPARSRSLGHRPPLDGVRGLAMLFVLLNHIGVALWTDAAPWLATGGAIGVDLFFVLSGVLIASLLLGDHARSGAVDVRGFIVRRTMRIVPALLAVLLALFVGSVLIDRLVLRDVLTSAAYSLTFTQNWSAVGFPLDSLEETFGGGTMVIELLHTWTLAIEVHFYLMWSLALWVAVRRGWTYRTMALVTVAAIALLATWRTLAYLDGTNWLVLRTLTFSRLDAPLVGTLVGIAFMAGWLSRPYRWLTAVGAVGLVAILGVGFLADSQFAALPLGLYTVMAGAAALCMAAVVADPGSPLARLLSMRWLIFLGTTSYSIYLWHQGLFLLFELHTPSWPDPVRTVVAVSVALVVGYVSHHQIERRFMLRGRTG